MKPFRKNAWKLFGNPLQTLWNVETLMFRRHFAALKSSLRKNPGKKVNLKTFIVFLPGAFFKKLDVSYATGPRYHLQLEEWVGWWDGDVQCISDHAKTKNDKNSSAGLLECETFSIKEGSAMDLFHVAARYC